MSHPLVVNVKSGKHYDVYCGRNPLFGDTKWGNIYSHMKGSSAPNIVASRKAAIEHHRKWFLTSPLRADLAELRGKALGCHCAPKACHCDTLAQFANPKRFLVCGPRDWQRPLWVYLLIAGLKREYGDDIVIIHGCARGVDTMAGEAADDLGLEVEEFPADWSIGRVAGPVRNREMFEEGQPDRVISVGQGNGTQGMVDIARAGGCLVVRRFIYCTGKSD